MTKFEIFSKENLGSVRVCYKTEDGSAWFIAKDVCDILGLGNARQALTRLLLDEKDDVISNDAIGRRQKMNVVSESGLYMLIMGSRKDAATEFQRWITREVLPSIRKNGSYVIGQEDMPEKEREAMLTAIAKLNKEKGAWKEDSDYWHEMYQNLLDEYIGVSQTLVDAGKYSRKANGGITPESERYKEGFIVSMPEREGVWTDVQMFVQNIETGKKYQIVEREMR